MTSSSKSGTESATKPGLSKDMKLTIGAIVVTGIVVGSLTFVLTSVGASGQLSDAAFNARVYAGIEKYIDDKEQQAQEAQAQATLQEAENSKALAANLPPVDVNTDHIYGEKNAPISLVEYSDFNCPYCQQFHGTAKQIVDKYGGKVNWVYRHFPLSGHDPDATIRAMASECVAELGGNGAFWEFGDLLFADASSDRESLVTMASQVGVNATAMGNCFDSQKHLAKVQQQLQEGSDSGVSGTPGNFIVVNTTGEAMQIPGGAKPLSTFVRVIDTLL